MPDIKLREKVRDVKTLDKSGVAGERMRHATVRTKNNFTETDGNEYESATDYAVENIERETEDTVKDVSGEIKKDGRKAVNRGKSKYREFRNEKKTSKHVNKPVGSRGIHDRREAVRDFSRKRNKAVKAAGRTDCTVKQTVKAVRESSVKTMQNSIKTAEQSVKTVEQTAKITVKTAEQTAKAAGKTAEAAAKASQKAAEAARQAGIAAYKGAVVAAKAVVAAVKAVIEGIEKLIDIISAGGWTAVVVIIVICMVGIIAGTGFGIFFSSGSNNDDDTLSLQQVVKEIDEEYESKLEAMKKDNAHDIFEITGTRAGWPEVLSVYAVKTSENQDEVATVTDEKRKILKQVFWDMNSISCKVEKKNETVISKEDDGHGNVLESKTVRKKKILKIYVSHKTAAEIAEIYRFNNESKALLMEMINQDGNMWGSLLYGVKGDGDTIVQIALSQIGNKGGEPYWSWYGFSSRVEWCGCFVSWCADQCGYIDSGVCPKFAGCINGVEWFKTKEQWIDGSVEPVPGMIIFFDWEDTHDGKADHVGIVERVENGYVYTVEGNNDDSCKESMYPLGYFEILGYGIIRNLK